MRAAVAVALYFLEAPYVRPLNPHRTPEFETRLNLQYARPIHCRPMDYHMLLCYRNAATGHASGPNTLGNSWTDELPLCTMVGPKREILIPVVARLPRELSK